MGMLIADETPYGKELWKWNHHQGETHPTDGTVTGMRPTHFQTHPAMMYKVTQKNPWVFEQEIAETETMQQNLESRGFVAGGKGAAVAAYDEAQQNLAVMAAVRNAEDRHMSPAALAESHAAEQESSRHLGEIPRTPVKRRGRPAKIATA